MMGHTLDSRVVLVYEVALDELDCESGFSNALCGVKSTERRET